MPRRPDPPRRRRGLLDVARENTALQQARQQNYAAGLLGGPTSDSQALTGPLQFIKAIVGQTPQYAVDEGGQQVLARPGRGLLGGFSNLGRFGASVEGSMDLTDAGDFNAAKRGISNAIVKAAKGSDKSWGQIGTDLGTGLLAAVLPAVTAGSLRAAPDAGKAAQLNAEGGTGGGLIRVYRGTKEAEHQLTSAVNRATPTFTPSPDLAAEYARSGGFGGGYVGAYDLRMARPFEMGNAPYLDQGPVAQLTAYQDLLNSFKEAGVPEEEVLRAANNVSGWEQFLPNGRTRRLSIGEILGEGGTPINHNWRISDNHAVTRLAKDAGFDGFHYWGNYARGMDEDAFSRGGLRKNPWGWVEGEEFRPFDPAGQLTRVPANGLRQFLRQEGAPVTLLSRGNGLGGALRSAIELPDGRMFTALADMPNNHSSAWEAAANELGMSLDDLLDMPGVVEGYEDGGKFLDRAAGLKRAKELGQYDPNGYSQGLGKLDSEDLLFAKGGSLGGIFRLAAPYLDRTAPLIEGTVQTPAGLLIPDPRTARTKISDLVQAITERPDAVRALLDEDVQRRLQFGQRLPGDEPWYELGALKQRFDAEGGPIDFDRWNIVGGIASQQNSVPMENAITSVLNHAMLFDKSHADALKEYARVTGDTKKLNTPADQLDRAYDMVHFNGGLLVPADKYTSSWKTPSYSIIRRGGGSVNDPIGRQLVALDTHERKEILNGAMQDPALREIATTPSLKTKTGELISPYDRAMKNKGQIPITNAQDYKALAESLYLPGALKFGFPTLGAYQAPRWEGGAQNTGVRSPLGRSYQQIFEDQMAETLMARGLEPTLRNMDGLFGKLTRGEDFLIMPGSWRKKFPIPDFLEADGF